MSKSQNCLVNLEVINKCYRLGTWRRSYNTMSYLTQCELTGCAR
jgi:hypothetical protein